MFGYFYMILYLFFFSRDLQLDEWITFVWVFLSLSHCFLSRSIKRGKKDEKGRRELLLCFLILAKKKMPWFYKYKEKKLIHFIKITFLHILNNNVINLKEKVLISYSLWCIYHLFLEWVVCCVLQFEMNWHFYLHVRASRRIHNIDK